MIEVLSVLKEYLSSYRDTLNNINVFPIADKDTGSNICKTLSLDNCNTLEDVKNQILMKARGSSGNIIALFAMGLWENKSDNLYEMCSKAAQFAWDTMFEPVEGTILTAMKDVPKEYDTLEDFIYKYVENTKNNLLKGPDLLPVLKENNTLDSGTLGFLYILCGIYKGLTGKDITPDIKVEKVEGKLSEVDYKYCVEVLFKADDDVFLDYMIDSIRPIGNELILIRQGNLSKLHIHTNEHETVFKEINRLFDVLEVKIDNMVFV